MNNKTCAKELAIFGAGKLFDNPKSTSNLVQPDIEDFLRYSKIFFDAQQYTNNGRLVTLLEKNLLNSTKHNSV